MRRIGARFLDSKKKNVNNGGFRFPTAIFFCLSPNLSTKKAKVLILLRKDGSGGWDRTNDQSVIPGHKMSQSAIFVRV